MTHYTPSSRLLLSVHMNLMTEKTSSPAKAGTPTFLRWFLSDYGLRAYPIALIILASTLYVAASIAVAVAGFPLPVSTIFTVAVTVFVVAYAVAKLRRGYRKATASTRKERPGSASALTSSGDSSYAPMIIPGMHHYDSPSHGGHSGKGHSDGGHSSHGGYDGGGYSGGSDSSGSSGGDGGGGGGGE